MSGWFVSVLVLIVVEAICIALLVGGIVLALRRYRQSRAESPKETRVHSHT